MSDSIASSPLFFFDVNTLEGRYSEAIARVEECDGIVVLPSILFAELAKTREHWRSTMKRALENVRKRPPGKVVVSHYMHDLIQEEVETQQSMIHQLIDWDVQSELPRTLNALCDPDSDAERMQWISKRVEQTLSKVNADQINKTDQDSLMSFVLSIKDMVGNMRDKEKKLLRNDPSERARFVALTHMRGYKESLFIGHDKQPWKKPMYSDSILMRKLLATSLLAIDMVLKGHRGKVEGKLSDKETRQLRDLHYCVYGSIHNVVSFDNHVVRITSELKESASILVDILNNEKVSRHIFGQPA